MLLYRNRNWLYQQYVVMRKTARQIAAEQSTTEATITRWLLRYDLIRNPRQLRR